MAQRYYISEQDRQTLKRLANQVGLHVSERRLPAARPLATLARSTEEVAPGAVSNFDLLQSPFPLSPSGVLREARNICGGTIPVSTDVELAWYTAQGTGGFWAASPCDKQMSEVNSCTCELITLLEANSHLSDITAGEWSTLKGNCTCSPTVDCVHCAADEMPLTLNISVAGTNVIGQITTGDTALGVDWASFVATTHAITMTGCTGELIVDCGTSTAQDDFGDYPIGSSCRCKIIAGVYADGMGSVYMEIDLNFEVFKSPAWEFIGGGPRADASVRTPPIDCQPTARVLTGGAGDGIVLDYTSATWDA